MPAPRIDADIVATRSQAAGFQGRMRRWSVIGVLVLLAVGMRPASIEAYMFSWPACNPRARRP